MTNPNGAVAGNSQNIPEAQTPRTRSTFPLHYHFFNTHRFGEYVPHYVEDLVKRDKLPIRSSHQLRSYTLDSPLMQNVKRNKDYFLVPLESILPNNWEKFFNHPVRGDDVLDDVGPSVENFWTKVANMATALRTGLLSVLNNSNTTVTDALTAVLRFIVTLEYFYSNGSLMSSLGCHGGNLAWVYNINAGVTTRASYDKMFDAAIGLLLSEMGTNGYFTLSVDGYNYSVFHNNRLQPGYSAITIRHALQLIRENPAFSIASWNGSSSALRSHFYDFFNSNWSFTFLSSNIPFDTSRLWAYQLCCAHYFTNDHIDFVYSAELFRQLIGNYLISASAVSGWYQSNSIFNRNGISYLYDFLSAHYVTLIFGLITSNASSFLTGTAASTLSRCGYLSALFGYRRSLRYLDYFTGSKAQPLAVASSSVNTNVSVSGNQVSVIDITKSIQAQRFLNAVNKVRHSFEGYLKGIFGGNMPAPDYHNPFYLAHTDDVIFGQETENTGAAQMTAGIAITTNLRSNSGNYMFEIEADRPCIAIGITSYDITRIYTKSIERAFFKQNRFDYFNPFMQYIGDQPVYLQELGVYPVQADALNLSNFAYAIRHEEYKQRFNQGSGGFVENLPGWTFLASDERGDQKNINPDWIRSLNAEFDQFFVSLTGYSLGSYWHFIVDDFNSTNASRPMAYAPTIL